MIEKNKILRKGYYLVTILSLLIFLGGMLSINIKSLSFLGSNDMFTNIIIGVPFSIWAWLIITGLLFVKKNWVTITILIVLAIPNIIAIALLHAYSNSILDILKWYVMILSFGRIII